MLEIVEATRIEKMLTVRAEEITTFNPEKESKKLKPIIQRRYRDTLAIARVLFIAHQFYTEIGKETRILNFKYITEVDLPEGFSSFKEFCKEAGLPKTTAYRFLEKFVPGSTAEEDRLLTPDEIAEIKAQKKQEEELRIMRAVAAYRKTGRYPEDWDCKCEHYLEKQLLQERLSKSTDELMKSGQLVPVQYELDFDGYVDKVLESLDSLEMKIAMGKELIRRIENKISEYTGGKK